MEKRAVPSDAFQLAVQRARRNFTEAEWCGLTFSDQARLIYQELDKIDKEVVATMVGSSKSHSNTAGEGADLTW